MLKSVIKIPIDFIPIKILLHVLGIALLSSSLGSSLQCTGVLPAAPHLEESIAQR